MAKPKGLGKGLNALMKQDVNSAQETTVKIQIKDIDPNPNQPRTHFDEDALLTLQKSIEQYGLVQPVVVRKVGLRYELVAGERRWRACTALGMKEIEAIVKDYSTAETTEIALVENLQRQDLDPIEEAYAYKRLMDTFKLTQEEIATKVGRSRSHIANIIRLLRLPISIQNALSVGDITIGQGRPLLMLKTKKQQEEVLAMILEKELNARQVEALVKQLNNPKSTEKRVKKLQETAEIRAWNERLKISLGTPVDIKINAGKKVKGKIEIQFASETELARLLAFLDEGQTHGGALEQKKTEEKVEIKNFIV